MIKSRINTFTAILHDMVVAAIAWWLAYLLRFNFELPPRFEAELLRTIVWVVPLQALVFGAFGLYRGIWRFASLPDLRRIVFAVTVAAIAIPSVIGLFRLDVIVPRSVLVLDPILLVLMLGGSRLLYRLWKDNLLYGSFSLRGEPVLILGAGQAGVGLSKELMRSDAWHVAGFLDDDAGKTGHTLNGIPVHGQLDELAYWTEKLGVDQVILAMPSASHLQRKRVVELANQNGIKVLTVPAFDDLLSGRVSVSQLRAVELDDLLGRDPVQLDDAGLHAQLGGKTILVTGGGGSIGSELCRQIARFAPAKLLIYEAGEFALYTIEQALSAAFPQLNLVCLAGDVRDPLRLEQVFAEHQPHTVYHAAAYKHVPLMECANAWQAVRNNVYGTWQVAQCAQRHGVEKFVLISTDKAVNPTNVMGATKRLAEMVCQGLQHHHSLSPRDVGGVSGSMLPAAVVGWPCKDSRGARSGVGVEETRFIIVRFGNVLGSNGSVIPKFREQIAKGGPVTVTHPEITRFFMSIPEAAQLVMQAGSMGDGGEIFVLDMGEPVKIVDLAKDMIRLSGLGEDEIKIEFTGLRPGEKLYEEVLADNEHTLPTPHPKLRIAQARQVADAELQAMLDWVSSSSIYPDEIVRGRLQQWVPEYTPTLNGH